ARTSEQATNGDRDLAGQAGGEGHAGPIFVEGPRGYQSSGPWPLGTLRRWTRCRRSPTRMRSSSPTAAGPPPTRTPPPNGSSTGGRIIAMPTNIREPDQVEALRDRAYDEFGHVDFLINNAGGQFPALPSQISDNGWRSVVDLNLNGTWNMINRFMGPMTEAGF